MAWRIEYSDTALQQLRKLDPPTARRILDYFDERVAPLAHPRQLGKALSRPFEGLWRYRIGDCRAICAFQDERRTVVVLRIGHRKDIYR